MDTPLVSVIMSVYNGEKYLSEAISSILDQSFSDFEFIIINDGSTDASEKIIQSFADLRIVYLPNPENKGLIFSLNRGLSVARGKFIARMDADDISHPDRLSEQTSYLQSHTNVVVLGTHHAEIQNKKIKVVGAGEFNSDYLKSILLFNPCFSHPTVMMRNIFGSSSLQYNAGFLHAEDYRLWTELSAQGDFYILNKALLRYRLHASQISSKHRQQQKNINSTIRKDYLNKLGFTFTDNELSIHNRIADHEFVTSFEFLLQVENWLNELNVQNKRTRALDSASFQNAIQKYWIDTCGNSNLGWRAYRLGVGSKLVSENGLRIKEKIKLLAKCFIRKVK